MWTPKRCPGVAPLAGIALLVTTPPLPAQVADTSRDTERVPLVHISELVGAVPGWECPMPVMGMGLDDPSAPSGMPIVPIDSTAAVPMPTLRRHCLNPRALAVPGSGPTPFGFSWPRADGIRTLPSAADTSPAFPRDLFDLPRPAPVDTTPAVVSEPGPLD